MNINIRIAWNEDSYSKTVIATESAVYKEIAKNLKAIKVPNTLFVCTPMGDAKFVIGKRGTFVKNGEKLPSMYVTEEYNNIHGLKASKYQERYLTCVNGQGNNYKFYHMKPMSNGIDVTYGRIGAKPGDPFGPKDINQPYPTYMYWIRFYEKLSKGYVDSSKIYLTPVVKKDEPKVEIVKSQNSVSAELFQKLRNYAKHVVSETFVDKNVTQGQIDSSKEFLQKLGQCTTLKAFNNQLMKLLSVSPRKTRYVQTLLAQSTADFKDIIIREENLIAAMEGAIDKTTVVNTGDFNGYGVEVYYATDKQKEQVMSHLNDTLKSKVKTIYRVIPKEQQKAFNDYLKKNHIKQVKQLWHGSRNENWFSIITNGLMLNPNAQITGKMFGQGIYFAPSAQKSWGYTSYYGSYWAGGNSGQAFMGLYATAYGTPLDVTSSGKYDQSIVTSYGCNCVHAHAGTYLRNDEIIYYDEAAMVLNYIVEFE